MWEKTGPRPPLALDANRVAKIEAPRPWTSRSSRSRSAKRPRRQAEKSKEKEGQTKRAKDKAGKPGARGRDPEGHGHPQGQGGHPAREGAEGRHPRASSASRRPRARGCRSCSRRATTSSRRWPAWRAPRWSAGHGAGGLSTSGSGPGGGGTGYGHIYGAGNLDTGGRGTHGRGRGPKLAERGEHEVSVGLGSGGGDTDGSLSKEQINKVVRAHMAGVKYCYEKELQHKASLAGGVDIFWVIQPDGRSARRTSSERAERRCRRGVHRPPGEAVAIPQGARPDHRRPLPLHLQGGD